MKSRLVHDRTVNDKKEWPVLARYASNGDEEMDFIVLFTACGMGVVVWTGEKTKHTVGSYHAHWENPYEGHKWTILPKGYQVVLEN